MAVKAFISYSHKDADLLLKLHEHLATLRRQGLLEAWTDREILPGEHIDTKVADQLKSADLYLLLISSAFIESSYCFEKEFACACERQAAGKAIIVPIIIRDCDWKIRQLQQFKVLPEDGKAVTNRHWHTLDEAFANVAEGLRALIEKGSFAKQRRGKPNKSSSSKFVPDERHITKEQRDQLGAIVQEIVERLTIRYANQPVEVLRKKQGRYFGIVWSQFNEKFNIPKLAALPHARFEEAKSWLQQYRASKNKNLKRTDPRKYRNSILKGIFGTLNSLQWTKEQLHAFASEQMGYPQPIQSLDDLGNHQLELIHSKLKYKLTKEKVKSGQARNRKNSAMKTPKQRSSDLSLCPTNVLVRWVQELAADGALTDNSPVLREVQLRAGYVKCPSEDLAAFGNLDQTVLIPLFGWTKLPPQAIQIPGAKYPPPPLYYLKQIMQNVGVIDGNPSKNKPALEIVVEPRIVSHENHKCLELPMWIINQAKTTADDVVVVLQKQPIGVFGVGYESCSQTTSGHPGNALKLNGPLNPGDRAFLCSTDLGRVEDGLVASVEPVEFGVKILARNQAAFDVGITFTKAELFAGKPKTAMRRG